MTASNRAQGLNMLHKHAQFEDGGVSVEAGLMAMLTRMQMGKLKVFKHLNDWLEEFRLYHRKDGKVVKEGDDLMAATRYGIMMLRFASTKATYDKFRRPIEYPKIKYVHPIQTCRGVRFTPESRHSLPRPACPLRRAGAIRSFGQPA